MSMDARTRNIQDYLHEQGLAPRNFCRPTPTSVAAAEAVGCRVGEIAKSILLRVGKQPVLVVTSGDARINSARLKQATGLTGKVKLPEADQVRQLTGYEPGAVSPFLLPEQLPVFLDASLQRFDRLYPAAASDSSAVAVSFEQLQNLCRGRVVDVCTIADDAGTQTRRA